MKENSNGMYLAIDIGGTKTLLGLFSANGHLEATKRFETPAGYEQFKAVLGKEIAGFASHQKLEATCCAIPGRINHESGEALGFGTLQWPAINLKDDIAKLTNSAVLVENDAKLAGLSEALLVLAEYKRVLYVTIGTGIGTALIVDGRIDKALEDSEGGQIWLDRDGKRIALEDLVSGRAIRQRYGQRVADLADPAAWQTITSDLAEGLFDLIAVVQPQAVIIGGGVGAHFAKFGELLNQKLAGMGSQLVPIPSILGAQRAEEAVIYGCYDYIRQSLHHQ